MTIQIFISCVSDEFGAYRDELRRQLKRPNVDIHVQEDFIETGAKLLETLDHYIAGCNAVIHLAGDMTGSWAARPAVQGWAAGHPNFAEKLPSLKQSIETGDPSVSYTQWEAYLAAYHGKSLVIAVPEPGAVRDSKYRSDPERKASQRAHLQRLRSLGHYAKITFGNTDQLAAGVLRSSILDLLVDAGVIARDSVTSVGERIRSVTTKETSNTLPYPSIGGLFKGRDQLIQDLRKSLQRTTEGSSASVISNAVYGLGGIGKTRLAVEYAWQHADDYNALLFVVANTPDDLRRNLAALAGPAMLNVREQVVAEEEVRVAAVLRWLQQHPGWLLIIDNVDTAAAAAAVEDLLPRLHGGHALITSRLARWSGSVARLDVDVLPEDAAHAFLLERTAKDRRKTADDDAQSSVLARELGYLALALEQAGAYINHHRLSFAQYLAQWRGNRDKVAAWFDPRVMRYPRSVAVTWQTSVDQLGNAARRLLQRLAWLGPEPIPEAILEIAVPDEASTAVDQSAAVAELESYTLVTRASDAATFTVHRLVQEVTRRSLVGENGRTALMAALVWINDAFSGDTDDLRVRPMLDLLAPHVRAVTDHADAADMPELVPSLPARLGDLLQDRVPLAEIEKLYRRTLAKFEALARVDPDNTDWQRDLSVTYNKLGDVLVNQGNLSEALSSFRNSLAIREHLAKADPNNVDRQHDLSVSYNKLGDVLVTQGKLPEALKYFQDDLAITERLAKSDSKNAIWQHDLSVAYDRVGDVIMTQGNLPEALKSFRDALHIRERLAKTDQNNAGWQRDLSVSYNKMGDVLRAQGDLAAALQSFRESLGIRERLAKADLNNAGWQRDISVSYNKIGDVLKEQDNLPEALQFFRDSVVIRERLAQSDPNNAGWQRDLSVSYNRIGGVLEAQGNLPEALKYFQDDLAIAERLARTDPDNAQWQIDMVKSHARLAHHGDDPSQRWALIAATLRTLKAANKLTAEQARWLPEVEKQLVAFEKESLANGQSQRD